MYNGKYAQNSLTPYASLQSDVTHKTTKPKQTAQETPYLRQLTILLTAYYKMM
jgi:hypothetical protein